MTTRRDFLKAGTAAGAAALVLPTLGRAESLAARASAPEPPPMDPAVKELLIEALNAAKMGGADFADVRIGRYRQNFVFTREQQIVNVVRHRLVGVGVRALVDGTWGFAATRDLTNDGVAAAAREAVAIAKANRSAGAPIACVSRRRRRRRTPHVEERVQIDPFTMPIEQKAELLLEANAEAMKVDGREVREQRPVLREGRAQLREHRRLGHHADGRAVAGCRSRPPRSRRTSPISRRAATSCSRRGAAGSTSLDAGSRRQRAASGARKRRQKLTAKPVEVGRYDLVLHPSHLWLTIHESHRPSDGARSRDGLRGELRRHQLRRAAGEDARQAQVRPGVHEHPGRSHAGRRAARRSARTTTA